MLRVGAVRLRRCSLRHIAFGAWPWVTKVQGTDDEIVRIDGRLSSVSARLNNHDQQSLLFPVTASNKYKCWDHSLLHMTYHSP